MQGQAQAGCELTRCAGTTCCRAGRTYATAFWPRRHCPPRPTRVSSTTLTSQTGGRRSGSTSPQTPISCTTCLRRSCGSATADARRSLAARACRRCAPPRCGCTSDSDKHFGHARSSLVNPGPPSRPWANGSAVASWFLRGRARYCYGHHGPSCRGEGSSHNSSARHAPCPVAVL